MEVQDDGVIRRGLQLVGWGVTAGMSSAEQYDRTVASILHSAVDEDGDGEVLSGVSEASEAGAVSGE